MFFEIMFSGLRMGKQMEKTGPRLRGERRER